MIASITICLVCLVSILLGLFVFAMLRSASITDRYLDDLDGAPDMDYTGFPLFGDANKRR